MWYQGTVLSGSLLVLQNKVNGIPSGGQPRGGKPWDRANGTSLRRSVSLNSKLTAQPTVTADGVTQQCHCGVYSILQRSWASAGLLGVREHLFSSPRINPCLVDWAQEGIRIWWRHCRQLPFPGPKPPSSMPPSFTNKAIFKNSRQFLKNKTDFSMPIMKDGPHRTSNDILRSMTGSEQPQNVPRAHKMPVTESGPATHFAFLSLFIDPIECRIFYSDWQ